MDYGALNFGAPAAYSGPRWSCLSRLGSAFQWSLGVWRTLSSALAGCSLFGRSTPGGACKVANLVWTAAISVSKAPMVFSSWGWRSVGAVCVHGFNGLFQLGAGFCRGGLWVGVHLLSRL